LKGIELDEDANRSEARRISSAQSNISVWVIPTNEELMIARPTGELLGLRGAAREETRTAIARN
jgi:acetate kinase